MLVCTVSTTNHLHRAMVMAASLKKHMPECKLIVFLVETFVPGWARKCTLFDQVILAKDLHYHEDFNKYIFKYNRFEAANSLKGQILDYMFKNFPEEDQFLYLDSDMKLYSPLTELDALFDQCSMIVTPHILAPEEDMFGITKIELCVLQTGIFNAGFIGMKRNEESSRFVKWWAERLDRFCYSSIGRGIFYDQKWLSLAPCFLDVHVLKHPGYNAACWNLSTRTIHSTDEDCYVVNDQPLRLFHFSGIDGRMQTMIEKLVKNRSHKNCMYRLLKQYEEELDAYNAVKIEKTRWSYGYFKSGETIEDKTRIQYRENRQRLYHKFKDPFLQSNGDFFDPIEGN